MDELQTKQLNNTAEAAQLLRAGEVIAFPTETVYGLGADATSDEAVSKIFAAKGRPGDNPLIVHIGAVEQLVTVVSDVSDTAQKLMDAFWPGPLTVILPKHENLSELVTAGLDTVGVRMPSHPVALELLRTVQLPIAAPSANVSGRPSPTRAAHVLDDLSGKIAGVLDGGAAEIGLESTVIDCSVTPPIIL
ncbi:MAG: L-threonylcarbamoyladenylate synthase, partial [Oscillospiraceae bacterium]|nr:L-threonylcarbamoyladenylate synthase [Oscillospiraceae bacterium]